MASNTYGAIKLLTAEDMGAVLKKKTGSADGYKPKEWADTINLMGLLPIRTASGTIAHFSDGADDVPMKSVVANITPIQSGTGTPSPSNPRPIIGTSVLNVEQRGKNLFDKTTVTTGAWLNNNGGTNSGTNRAYSDFIPIKLNQPYYVTKAVGLSAFYTAIIFDSSKAIIGTQSILGSRGASGTLTFTSGAYIRINVDETDLNDVQLELGSTATTFEPYNAETYTFDLGRTIYGGTADVVGGTGSKTHGFLTLNGSENWVNVGGSYPQAFQLDTGITNAFQGYVYEQKPNNISNLYPWATNDVENYAIRWQVGVQSGRLFVYDNNYSSNLAGFKQHLSDNNLQIAYLLATPTDFTFTGQPINSYLGVNNVWTDSGEVLDVEYRADVNLLISELGG